MYRNILVPIDINHGEVGEKIVGVARHLAGPDGKITLLYVLEAVPSYVMSQLPVDTISNNLADAKEKLTAMARALKAEGATVLVKQGHSSNTILDEAEALGADCIVLGSHRPDYSDYLIGSTAARVVRHAQCTVVVERSAAGV
jgi:nucleotide-binding universal stress UspA family protein